MRLMAAFRRQSSVSSRLVRGCTVRAIRELCYQQAWEGRLSLGGLCNFPDYELEVCGAASPSHSTGGEVGTERTPM